MGNKEKDSEFIKIVVSHDNQKVVGQIPRRKGDERQYITSGEFVEMTIKSLRPSMAAILKTVRGNKDESKGHGSS